MSYGSTSSDPSLHHQWHSEDNKFTLEKQVEYRKLKQSTNALLQELKEKENNLQLARDSLQIRRTTIAKLKEACLQTNADIKKAKEQHNIPSLGLLETKLNSCQKEIEVELLREHTLEKDVTDKEVALAESEMKAIDCEDMQKELEDMERNIKQYKQKQAIFRAQGQMRQMIDTQRLQQQAQDKGNGKGKKGGTVTREQIDMKQTKEAIARRREDEANKEKQKLAQYENRVRTLLTLKKSVDKSKDTLRAKHLLEKEKQHKIQEIEQEIKSRAMETNSNPQELLLRKKTKENYEKQKREFDVKHKERQLKIVSKLLEEQQIQDKRDNQLSQPHWQYRHSSDKHDMKNKKTTVKQQKVILKPLQEDVKEIEETNENISAVRSDQESTKLDIVPDIPGLWEEQANEPVDTSFTKMSKMEKDILHKRLDKLKSNLIKKQVIAGKEFKGQALISKPSEITFKDFEIGKSYKKKVQLTNISYSMVYCKLIGVSEHLKDFFEVIFEPPGTISPGLTCHMNIHFQPKTNSDLSGHVELLSDTGPMLVPIKCCTKKCIISVENDCISFESICIGESATRVITVHNKGALSTTFELLPIDSRSRDIQSHDTQEMKIVDSDNSQQLHLAETSHISMLSAVDFKHVQGIGLANNSAVTKSSYAMNEIDTSRPIDIPKITGTPQQKKEPLKDTSSKSTSSQSSNRKSQGKASQETAKSGSSIEKEAEEDCEQQEVVVTHCESIEAISPMPDPSITIGEISSGIIQPYSSLNIKLIFSPILPDIHQANFELKCSEVPPIVISASGEGLALPVYVEKEVLDFKICLTDMLYQDTVNLYNRSITPHNMVFRVPPPLRDCLEVLPHHGLIQGESSFAAQVKLQPNKDLLNSDYVDSSSGTLRVPVDVNIKGQAVPVSFLVTAHVTVSDIELSPSSIDFGSCTVYESLVHSIDISNKACLPMDYGFIHVPMWLSVQPNDGFGTLLPHESISIDVVFNPDVPKTYSATLTCKSAINKDVKLSVSGKATQPPLRLSENDVMFAGTPYGTSAVAKLTVENPILSRMDSSVIRGVAPPEGSYLFEFKVPEDIPVRLSPHTASVGPGESVKVNVVFSPTIDSNSIMKEAIKLKLEDQQAKEKESAIASQTVTTEQTNQKQHGRGNNKGSLKSNSKGRMTPSQPEKSEVDNTERTKDASPPTKGSEWWNKAYNKLLRNASMRCDQWSIPCFISNNAKRIRLEDTLYLDVTAPTIKPCLVLEPDTRSSTIDFKQIAIGDYSTKTVVLKNISSSTLALSSTPFTSSGIFELRNALRPVSPNAVHSLIIRFSPNTNGKWFESVKIFYSSSMYLELVLQGEGMNHGVTLAPDKDTLDYGHVMMGDKYTNTLKLTNPSKLALSYRFVLDEAPDGRNCNGLSPVKCTPFKGTLQPESDIEVVVEFTPDHAGRSFTDSLSVEINSQVIKRIGLCAYTWASNMYMIGGINTLSKTTSMESSCVPEITPPMILVMTYLLSSGEKKCERQFEVGCIKTTLVKKSTGEYVIDQLQGPWSKCFTIDPMKSMVEAGGTKTVTVTFTLPEDVKEKCIEARSTISLKGDTTSQHQLLIQVDISN